MKAQHPDVAVIGGGIVGACVAYELSRRGRQVTVFDPAPGQGSSWGNAGMVSPSYCRPVADLAAIVHSLQSMLGSAPVATLARPLPARTLGWLFRLAVATRHGLDLRRADRLYRLAVTSLARYQQLVTEEGLDLGLRHDGWLWLYRSETGLAKALAVAERLREVGVASRTLHGDDLAKIQGGLDEGLRYGLHYPGDAVLDPGQANAAILAAAQRAGTMVVRESVRDLHARRGRVVTLAAGRDDYRPDEVVLCAGAYSGQVARQLGARVPIVPGYGWSLTIPTDTPIARLPVMLADDHVVVSPQPGRVRLTSGMQFGGGADRPPPAKRLAQLRAAAERALPAIRNLGAGQPWRGARPMTVDGEPIIERLAGYQNATLAAGHGVLGVTLAPATALRVAEILGGER